MKNRKRSAIQFMVDKVLLWAAERILGSIPVVGPFFKLGFFLLA